MMEHGLMTMTYLDSVFAGLDGGWRIFAIALCMVVALLNCFFGYRLLKLWMTIVGFFLGMVGGWALALHFMPDQQAIAILIGVVAGLLIGFLAYRIYLAGVFLICGIMVGVFAYGMILHYWPGLANWIPIVLAVLIGLLCGVLSIWLAKPMIILVTAFTGASMSCHLLFTLLSIVNQTTVLIILCVVMGIIGAVLQFATTKKIHYK